MRVDGNSIIPRPDVVEKITVIIVLETEQEKEDTLSQLYGP